MSIKNCILLIVLTFFALTSFSQDLEIQSDTSELRMIDTAGHKRVLLSVKGNKSGVTAFTPGGLSVAQLVTASNGLSGRLILENDSQVASLVAQGGSSSLNTIPNIKLKGESTKILLNNEENKERIKLSVTEDKAGLVLSNQTGSSVAELITSDDGKSGKLLLEDDNQKNTILIQGGSVMEASMPSVTIKADSAVIVMKGNDEKERIRLFVSEDKSGVVASNSKGESVAQMTTTENGKSGILALENEGQVPTIFAQGGAVSAGAIPLIRMSGDSTMFQMRSKSFNERTRLFVEDDKSGLVFFNKEGESVAQMTTSEDGKSGVLALENEDQEPTIFAQGGAASEGTMTLIRMSGDSTMFQMRSKSFAERTRLFIEDDKSGLVVSDPAGNAIAELMSTPEGDAGQLSLKNDSQSTTIMAQAGSDEEFTDPLLQMKGDFTKFVMQQDDESERVRLFVDDLKSGVVVFNPEGESVAQMITDEEGEYGIMAIENDEQVPTIIASGGHSVSDIPPSIRIKGETSKLDFVGENISNLSLELDDGEPLVSMFSKSGQRLVELGLAPFAFNVKDNVFKLYDQDTIFFSLRNDGLATNMNLDNGKIGLYNQVAHEPYMLLEGDEVGGTLVLSKLDNTAMVKLSAGTDNGFGSLGLFGANGSLNILATEPVGADNHGALSIINDLGASRVRMVSTLEGNGQMDIKGANGNNNVFVASASTPDRAYLHIANTAGAGRAGGYIHTDEKGILFAERFSLINTGNAEVGSLSVNTDGESVIDVHTVAALMKNFKIDHPSQADKEIWYASIEGPEAAAYVRGTGTLSNGKATIHLPDYFSEIVELQGMTVLLTPLSGASKGMAVVGKEVDQFSVIELLEGNGSYQFDWEVKAIRSGLENFEVVRNKPSRFKSNDQNPLSQEHIVYKQKGSK